MPFLAIGGLWAASTLGFLHGCDLSPHAAGVQASEVQPVRGPAPAKSSSHAKSSAEANRAEEQELEALLTDIRSRAQQIAEALELTAENQVALQNILLHEADRLDATSEQESHPLMQEDLAEYRQAVAEWRTREIRRQLGAVVAERIANYEVEEAARITITPAHATSRR